MRSKNLIPKVMIIDELPQWIISSDKAAYTPFTRTIWISKNKNPSLWSFSTSFIHEFGHHLIEVITGSKRRW